MKIFFEPNDFLFFRDNKPFSRGEAFAARSVEMPLPSVLYGAIRTQLLQQADVDFSRFAGFDDVTEGASHYPIVAATGTPTQPGSLAIKGPYFAELKKEGGLNQVLYSLPLDIVQYEEKSGEDNFGILKPSDDTDNTIITNSPMNFLRFLQSKTDFQGRNLEKESPNGLLPHNAFEDYLKGSSPSDKGIIKSSCVLQAEQRIGIEIGENYVTRNGRLYTLEVQRLHKGWGLALEIDGVDNLNVEIGFHNSILHLGGERRFGWVSVVNTEITPAPPADLAHQFKLVLTTPAVFKNGWLPGWLDEITGEGKLPYSQLKVKLIAAMVGKPVIFSGYDLSLNLPKRIRRAVPAGSVYYFDLLEGEPVQVKESLHNRAISDEFAHCQAGFGVAFVGNW